MSNDTGKQATAVSRYRDERSDWMTEDVSITDADAENLEDLASHIKEHDAAGSMAINYDRGRVTVNQSFEDGYSGHVRKDYVENRVDRQLVELVERIEAMNWNHFSPDEMADIIEAADLLAGVSENVVVGTRLSPQCTCGENEACHVCGGEDIPKQEVEPPTKSP